LLREVTKSEFQREVFYESPNPSSGWRARSAAIPLRNRGMVIDRQNPN